MGKLQIFKNEEFGKIRAIEVDGKPYFVGKDVAEILGYKNPSEAIIEHVDNEDKLNSKSLLSFEINLGQRGGWIINESGLYSLILSSKLPSARKFKRWVTNEVLPSIFRHGMYATDELLENPDLMIEIITKLKQERTARKLAEEEKKRLQIELDYSKEWYSIKRVAALNNVSYKTFEWQKLKNKSKEMGFEIKKVFDANYGCVNTYHYSVWESVYPNYEL